ncbi:hypothetical protein E2C01_002022 [Portunus trituberculatus]|uniref:Uncharacterized protein n=1 Tax=Portunus trituberculatus TaxID=210409 RepID=A0A5B7CI97_PORTR|nr:hypothetical protein [Portunus trituberculatus]
MRVDHASVGVKFFLVWHERRAWVGAASWNIARTEDLDLHASLSSQSNVAYYYLYRYQHRPLLGVSVSHLAHPPPCDIPAHLVYSTVTPTPTLPLSPHPQTHFSITPTYHLTTSVHQDTTSFAPATPSALQRPFTPLSTPCGVMALSAAPRQLILTSRPSLRKKIT